MHTLASTRIDRLAARVEQGSQIVVICAPPGFGKSKLLNTIWKESQKSKRTLYFDRIDHLADPRIAARAIVEQNDVACIFVSDVEACDAEFLHLALERLVRTGANRRVFLGGRDPSALDFGAQRGTGVVEWIEASALASDVSEARLLFAKIGRPEDRKRIATLAGNWPVAIDMLVDWALRTNQNIRDLEDADLLHQSGLFEFIEKQVWPMLEEGERAALARAALLNHPERHILRNAQGYDRVLARLVIRLGGLVGQSAGQFWVNPALRSFSQEYSLLGDAEAQRCMMLELADRCADLGQLSDAARLAAAAGRPERIREYADQHGALLIWVLCGFSDLQSLVANAGDEVIAQSPVLRMMRCIVDLKRGQIKRAEAELHDLSIDPAIADTMKKEVEIIRVTLLVYGCSFARQNDLELLADLLAEQSTEPAWQSFLATLGCILNSQRARFGIALANLREARRESERAGSRYNLMFLFLHEAGIEIARGDLAGARACIASARKMWREEFSSDIGVETVISALSSKVEFETGRLTSARNSLRKSANRLPDGEAWFDIYFAAYEPMARMHLRDFGLARAIEFIEIERVKLEARGLTRVARLLNALAWCLVGEVGESGEEKLGAFGDSVDVEESALSWQERETYSLAEAYGLFERGQTDDAIGLLERAREVAIESSVVHSQLRLGLTLFLLLHRIGRRSEALDCLEGLVIDASRVGMRQVIQDVAGPITSEYREMLISRGSLDEGQLKFLDSLGRDQRHPGHAGASLSKRELEVIETLAEGSSDKELARTLGISDHGVRYHLKNIFRKLEVHDRLSAVVTARKIGWI